MSQSSTAPRHSCNGFPAAVAGRSSSTPVEAWTPNEYLKEVQGFEFYHEQLAAGKDEQGLIDAAMGKVYEGYRNPEKMSYPYDKAVAMTRSASITCAQSPFTGNSIFDCPEQSHTSPDKTFCSIFFSPVPSSTMMV